MAFHTLMVIALLAGCVQGQTEGGLRLFGNGRTYLGQNGIVQVYYSDQWGNICGPFFGSAAADVVCHQLGYSGGTSSTAGNSNFGRDTSVGVITDVSCSTDYLVILQCGHVIPTSSCSDDDDITVFCYSTRIWNSPYSGMVRLVNGIYAGIGRVEVYCNGMWGLVCYDLNSIDSNAATTVCNQLGYNTAEAYGNNYGNGSTNQPVWLKNLNCGGFDRSCLSSCQNCPSNEADCAINDVLGVTCGYGSNGFGSTRYTCEFADSNLSVGAIVAIIIGSIIACLVCTFLIAVLPFLICCCLGVGIGAAAGSRRSYSTI